MEKTIEIINACIKLNNARFIVFDDGSMFIEPKHNAKLTPFVGNSNLFTEETKKAKLSDRKMVSYLLSEELQKDFSLGYQKQEEFAIFTIMSLETPLLI